MTARPIARSWLVVTLVTILAACASNSSQQSGAQHKGTSAAAAPTRTSGRGGSACALVSAAALHSLRITAPGSPSRVHVGTATTYGCTWGRPPAVELHLQYESVDRAAATQVRESLGGHGAVVPGIGDGARGQFGSVLLAVNFWTANTFVSMQIFGAGAGKHKAAFLAVAKAVASHF